MKVYVVTAYESYPSYMNVGVFSSEDKARKKAEACARDSAWSAWENFDVEEFILDGGKE